MFKEIKEFVLVSLIEGIDLKIHISNLDYPLTKVYVFLKETVTSPLKKRIISEKIEELKKDGFEIAGIEQMFFGRMESVIYHKKIPSGCVKEHSKLRNFTVWTAYDNNKKTLIVVSEIIRHINYAIRKFLNHPAIQEFLKSTEDIHVDSKHIANLKNKILSIIAKPPLPLGGELKSSKMLFLLQDPFLNKFAEDIIFTKKEIDTAKERYIKDIISKFLMAKCDVKLHGSSFSLTKKDIYLKSPQDSKRKKITSRSLLETIQKNMITIKKSNIFIAYLYPVFEEFLVLEVYGNFISDNELTLIDGNFYDIFFSDQYERILKFIAVDVFRVPEKEYTTSLFEAKQVIKLLCRTYVVSVTENENLTDYIDSIAYYSAGYGSVKSINLDRRRIVWHTNRFVPLPLHISDMSEFLYCLGYDDSLNVEYSIFGNLDEYFENFVAMKVFLFTNDHLLQLLNKYRMIVEKLKNTIVKSNSKDAAIIGQTSDSLYEVKRDLIQIGETIRTRKTFVDMIQAKKEKGLKAYDLVWWEDLGDFSDTEVSTFARTEVEEHGRLMELIMELDSLIQFELTDNLKEIESKENNFLNKIVFDRVFVRTPSNLLRYRKNNYSAEAKLFQSGRVKLVDFFDEKELLKIDKKGKYIFLKEKEDVFRNFLENEEDVKSLSIIIPVKGRKNYFLECIQGILRQSFVRYHSQLVELIVIQDGYSKNPSNNPISKELGTTLSGFRGKIKLFKLAENKGRSTARNVGIFNAKNDIIFFIDSTMILDKDFLAEHMVRHDRISRISLLGFKENIELKNFQRDASKIRKGEKRADFRKDLKYSHILKEDEAPFEFKSRRYKPNEKINYMKLTANFSELKGLDTVGFRSLATFFQTNIVSAPLIEVINVGGFACEFDPMWGLEDSFLGALLIAKGVKIIPCPSSVAFKIEHGDESEIKLDELERNRQKYSELLTKTNFKAYRKDRLAKKIRQLKRLKILEKVEIDQIGNN